MSTDNHRVTTREVQGTVIPAGDAVNLPAGTAVDITHRLGGNFTVVCDYGMFRILGKDADALGEEIPEDSNESEKEADDHQGPPDGEAVWEAMKTVYDPEIPVNIVDLGLVYSMNVSELGDNRFGVDVKMTLTAPGCGMGPAIADDAKNRIEAVPGASSANVEIVWDPPWTQDMISEEGKMQLGLI